MQPTAVPNAQINKETLELTVSVAEYWTFKVLGKNKVTMSAFMLGATESFCSVSLEDFALIDSRFPEALRARFGPSYNYAPGSALRVALSFWNGEFTLLPAYVRTDGWSEDLYVQDFIDIDLSKQDQVYLLCRHYVCATLTDGGTFALMVEPRAVTVDGQWFEERQPGWKERVAVAHSMGLDKLEKVAYVMLEPGHGNGMPQMSITSLPAEMGAD